MLAAPAEFDRPHMEMLGMVACSYPNTGDKTKKVLWGSLASQPNWRAQTLSQKDKMGLGIWDNLVVEYMRSILGTGSSIPGTKGVILETWLSSAEAATKPAA